MVGHDVRTEKLHRRTKIWRRDAPGGKGLTPRARISEDVLLLRCTPGEVLGFTGLLGDGRSELFQAVFGAYAGLRAKVFVGRSGQAVITPHSRAGLRPGVGYVPRNRKENGIIKDMSILGKRLRS